MRFQFVRHAQPAWSLDGRSVDDPGLTELGHRQGDALRRRFTPGSADLLVASPLRRAQQTAAYVAEGLELEPITAPWLAEITNPTWEGTPADDIERLFADARRRPVEEHWEGLPGGESFRTFHRRVTHGLQELLDEQGGARVHDQPALWRLDRVEHRIVVVAHAGTNAVALGYLLGLEPVPWEWERFVSFHASVSELRPAEISGDHAYSLFRFSDVDHLPDDLRTH